MKSLFSNRALLFALFQTLLIILFVTLGCDILKDNPTVYVDPMYPDQFDATVYWDDRNVGALINQGDEVVIENVSKREHRIKCYIYNVSQRDAFWDERTVNVNGNEYIKVGPAGIVL